MKNSLFIKKTLNFLEYPNWVVSQKIKLSKVIIHRDEIFYEMKSEAGLPTRFDKIILGFLMQKLFLNESVVNYTLITTRYEIAKNIYSASKSFSKQKYERIMLALKRWNVMCIRFEDIVSENGHRSMKYFSVIDSVNLDKNTHKLTIQFNQDYIKQTKSSMVFNSLDITAYKKCFLECKKLARPLSMRLYEILLRNLLDRYVWCIDISHFALLLTLEGNQPPSRVLQLLKPAIEEVNKQTHMNIDFDYDKQRSLCIFKKRD